MMKMEHVRFTPHLSSCFLRPLASSVFFFSSSMTYLQFQGLASLMSGLLGHKREIGLLKTRMWRHSELVDFCLYIYEKMEEVTMHNAKDGQGCTQTFLFSFFPPLHPPSSLSRSYACSNSDALCA